MAKQTERLVLKKGMAQFNLVGKAKVTDFTFTIDAESKTSDWVYNKLNLGVECGESGTIYAEMMGGYGSERANQCYVHGTKDSKDGKTKMDDFENKFQIDWEDRFDEEILKSVGEMCFITIGLEKDDKDKTVYKKFLSEYDAITYINENLEDGMVVNVKGNLNYSIYGENVQIKKNITSISLSKATPEQYKATFTQTLLLDGGSVGKLDKETMSIPVYARVVDYTKLYEDKLVKRMIPFNRTFEIKVTKDEVEKIKKFLKLFKAKTGKITSLTVEGKFSRGEVSTVQVSDADIPDDIKELIEDGYIDEKEVLDKIALKNGGGNKPEVMIITSPHIKYVGEDVKSPSIDRIADLYDEDDLSINSILSDVYLKEKDNEKNEEDVEIDTEKLIDEAAGEVDDAEGDDDAWLNDL